ncbi:MAG: FAD-dependent oxidoreductase [Marmoricola sp.]
MTADHPLPSSATRRGFLGISAAAVAGASLAIAPGTTAPVFAAGLTSPKRRVVVLGGGVGGLTAAHELAERGFEVTVVEPKALGGKARSIPVAGTGTNGRDDLPGEHGFRFFPGFYQNIPDTMRRVPVPGNAEGVFSHLVDAKQVVLTTPGGGQLWAFPTPDKYGAIEGMTSLVTALGIAMKVPANEIEYFVRKLSVFLTSSDQRRRGQWEYVSWTKFTNSDNFSPTYQSVFGSGLTKSLVAAKGNAASTRTVGLMGEAFVYALLAQASPSIRRESGYGAADRLLDLPTNEAWINPWTAHLRSLGVTFVGGQRAAAINLAGGKVASVTLQPTDSNGEVVPGGSTSTFEADWFVFAMPVEQITKLLTPAVLAADPGLGRLRNLRTDWMNGIQFFLSRRPDIPIKGHVAYLDTPWALTSIEQGNFWRRPMTGYGNGGVQDIWSVDVSDWFTPGVVYGKAAADCTPDQIAHEVWEQMKRSLNRNGLTVLSDGMLASWFLDPAIHYPNGPTARAENREQLLINTAGSLDDRPTASSRIPNMFLASDYVRTNVDLATMEGANEAGREAANSILLRSGAGGTPATIKGLWQPRELALVRQTDATLYKLGLPNALDVVPAGLPL